MSRKVETTVTFLKMQERSHEHVQPPSNLKIALMRLEKPPVAYYRYLYSAVGENYDWVDRKALSDEKLLAEIDVEGVNIYVAYVGGVPAGYFELDARKKDQVWLAYFGITQPFIGTGLGKWLLCEAIATAWLGEPKSVHVETCTLDHPRALPLYQRMGFEVYERQERIMVVPD